MVRAYHKLIKPIYVGSYSLLFVQLKIIFRKARLSNFAKCYTSDTFVVLWLEL